MKHGVRSFVIVSVAVGTVSALVNTAGAAGGAPPASGRLHLSAAGLVAHGPRLGIPARQALRYGYLVPNRAAYDRAKAAAAARLTSHGPTSPASVASPTAVQKWKGISDTSGTPSDSTGAIGTTRYIETVNSKFAIYDRSHVKLSSGTLTQLWGAGAFDNVFDPQIMWDNATQRFYYTGDDVVDSSDNLLAFGFSKTASPNTKSDWCKYNLNYGSEFPDYPKLGDDADFAMIGVNVFASSGSFRGSDLVAISKPTAGSACPDPTSFQVGVGSTLMLGAKRAFTPVPAAESDDTSTGYSVTRSLSLPATQLGLFKVTRNLDGTPNVSTTGAAVTVPSYAVPPPAPQSGTAVTLDTSDTRPTQAVAAIDPLHQGKLALWTQHTVAGGAGSQVRWYEIDAVAAGLLQSGKVTSTKLFVFNGAISPDRSSSAFGSDMVLGYNTSSSSTFPSVKMVSKVGANPQSSPVTIKTSPGPDIDFSCGPTCRWGDYSAATPDPAATGTVGSVWLTNMWSNDSTANPSGVNWQTENWQATP